jgi:hypothetical protein
MTETRHLHTEDRRHGERRSNWRHALEQREARLLVELDNLVEDMCDCADGGLPHGPIVRTTQRWADRLKEIVNKHRNAF